MVKKNYDDMLSRFHLIPERYGRTDGQTDRFAISVSRVSVLTRDKKCHMMSADKRMGSGANLHSKRIDHGGTTS